MRGRDRGDRGRVRASDVVGVPMLPPARMTTATTRLRAALLSLHRRMAPPPVGILESMLGLLDNAALVACCELGIPERLTRPMRVDELGAALGVEVEPLDRLLRFAAARGWLAFGRGDRVKPTRTTRFLRADHPGGWRAWVDFAGSGEVWSAARALSDSTRAGTSGFAHAHGAEFFAWMTDHPARHAVFDGAMDAGARLHALALSAALPWREASRVCDVGGGSGALLRALLGAHPHLSGVLFDLPAVIARAEPHDRIEPVGGDAFAAVPAGCDTYLLVNVLHDWGDDDCARLLGRVADAMPADGRVVVVDGERAQRALDTMSTRTDLLMLVLTATGKERTTAEFGALGGRAGLRLARSIELASGDRAHVFSRAPA